jgi:hypothetical protein
MSYPQRSSGVAFAIFIGLIISLSLSLAALPPDAFAQAGRKAG